LLDFGQELHREVKEVEEVSLNGLSFGLYPVINKMVPNLIYFKQEPRPPFSCELLLLCPFFFVVMNLFFARFTF